MTSFSNERQSFVIQGRFLNKRLKITRLSDFIFNPRSPFDVETPTSVWRGREHKFGQSIKFLRPARFEPRVHWRSDWGGWNWPLCWTDVRTTITFETNRRRAARLRMERLTSPAQPEKLDWAILVQSGNRGQIWIEMSFSQRHETKHNQGTC